MASLRERLEQARNELGWSMREMSRRAKLASETHYQLIVRRLSADENADIELETVTKLARALEEQGYGRDWILYGRGVPKPLGKASARFVEPDPRYTHREQAMRILVDGGEGTDVEVRAAADAAGVALEAHEDPPVIEWIDTIRLELRRQRKGRPELGRRTATDEDFEE